MQILEAPYLFFTFPKTQNPSKPEPHPHTLHNANNNTHHSFNSNSLFFRHKTLTVPLPLPLPKCFRSDEFPVDESFVQKFTPKDKETEDEARRRNWIGRGWAPWEEILTLEGDFAKKSLNEGEEVPLKTPEAIEAFRMLNPDYRAKRIKEMGLTEDEWYKKQFEIRGDIPEPLTTYWAGPLVVRLVAPRDWPPRGWEVDKEELRFIREGHKLMAERVDVDNLERDVKANTDDISLERYGVFLKQYKEWVDANKDRLEEESYKYDQDYHPGRRKRGKDYEEGMLELPYFYPGQVSSFLLHGGVAV